MNRYQWLTRTSVAALAMLTVHTGSVHADEGEEPSDGPKPITKVLSNVEKSVWASDLSAPHGLTRDFAGNVYATEFTAGRIAKLSPDGKISARFGEGLKSPAWIARDGDRFLITERKANRVLALSSSGQFTTIGQEIIEPLGITTTPQGRAVVVAHTTSRIFDAVSPAAGTNSATWRNIYSAPSENGRRYGLRCVAIDRDGSLLVTDETDGKLMLISPAGRAATLVSGLDDPTGVALSPQGAVFVAEEGAGRVSRVENDGSLTIIADGLGQPRGLVFLDPRTLLVADREGGKIWRVVLPRS